MLSVNWRLFHVASTIGCSNVFAEWEFQPHRRVLLKHIEPSLVGVAGPVPAIHVFAGIQKGRRDARDKPGHHDNEKAIRSYRDVLCYQLRLQVLPDGLDEIDVFLDLRPRQFGQVHGALVFALVDIGILDFQKLLMPIELIGQKVLVE